MKAEQLTLLGNPDAKVSKKLETFPYEYADKSRVTFTTQELLCNCPITGQPDHYHLTITYYPGKECLETKSLKLYLMTFRDAKYFAEDLVHIIRRDLQDALPTHSGLSVEVTQQIRGGIETTVETTSTF
jgi:7-cyano-7-deazaguanine reductase